MTSSSKIEQRLRQIHAILSEHFAFLTTTTVRMKTADDEFDDSEASSALQSLSKYLALLEYVLDDEESEFSALADFFKDYIEQSEKITALIKQADSSITKEVEESRARGLYRRACENTTAGIKKTKQPKKGGLGDWF